MPFAAPYSLVKLILERWQIDCEEYVSCGIYILRNVLKQVCSLPFSEQQRFRQWLNCFQISGLWTFFEVLIFHPNLRRDFFKLLPVISAQEFIFQKSYSCLQTLMMINLLLHPSDSQKPPRADNHGRACRAATVWKGETVWALLLL